MVTAVALQGGKRFPKPAELPVEGDGEPTQQALDLAWFTPEEAVSEGVREQMTSGHDRLIRLALAHVDALP